MSGQLHVELVAADRVVWSGEAVQVNARTAEGDIGVLAGHTPVLSLLVPSVVEIDADDRAQVFASVDGGFLSIANNRVSILSENVQLAQEIDAAQARADLEAARAEAGSNAEFDPAVARAQALVDAAAKAS